MFDADIVFNANETHFSLNLDDGRAVEMKGDIYVHHSDLISRDMERTMMVMLGGCSRSRFEIRMICFQKDGFAHPIKRVPNNIPGVCY